MEEKDVFRNERVGRNIWDILNEEFPDIETNRNAQLLKRLKERTEWRQLNFLLNKTQSEEVVFAIIREITSELEKWKSGAEHNVPLPDEIDHIKRFLSYSPNEMFFNVWEEFVTYAWDDSKLDELYLPFRTEYEAELKKRKEAGKWYQERMDKIAMDIPNRPEDLVEEN